MSTTDLSVPGLLVGRYRLVERLGAGGMSVVWRGFDEVLGRQVAVKVLPPSVSADPSFRRRLRAEAQAAARLSHPHITNVYDYGESVTSDGDPVPFVVMELVDGESLAGLLSRMPQLPWQLAVRICAQVSAALAAAHARGIVHRDVTPANVMLTSSGAKVVDFGISALIGENDIDPDGSLLGTPAYLAPERLEGGQVSPASDVYAVGLLIYRAVIGQLPWDVGTTTALLRAHQYTEPEPLPAVEGMPRAVNALVGRCLEKKPADRPPSAELAVVLAEIAATAPVAHPSSVTDYGQDTTILPSRAEIDRASAELRSGELASGELRSGERASWERAEPDLVPPVARPAVPPGVPPAVGRPARPAAGGSIHGAEQPVARIRPSAGSVRPQHHDSRRFAAAHSPHEGAGAGRGPVVAMGSGPAVVEAGRRRTAVGARRLSVVVGAVLTVGALTYGLVTYQPTGTNDAQAFPRGGVLPEARRCAVTYRISSHTGTNFVVVMTVTNRSSTKLVDWKLRFVLRGDQRFTRIGGAELSQQGQDVTIQSKKPMAPHRTIVLALGGGYRTNNEMPVDFDLADVAAGVACDVYVSPTPGAAPKQVQRTPDGQVRFVAQAPGTPVPGLSSGPAGYVPVGTAGTEGTSSTGNTDRPDEFDGEDGGNGGNAGNGGDGGDGGESPDIPPLLPVSTGEPETTGSPAPDPGSDPGFPDSPVATVPSDGESSQGPPPSPPDEVSATDPSSSSDPPSSDPPSSDPATEAPPATEQTAGPPPPIDPSRR